MCITTSAQTTLPSALFLAYTLGGGTCQRCAARRVAARARPPVLSLTHTPPSRQQGAHNTLQGRGAANTPREAAQARKHTHDATLADPCLQCNACGCAHVRITTSSNGLALCLSSKRLTWITCLGPGSMYRLAGVTTLVSIAHTGWYRGLSGESNTVPSAAVSAPCTADITPVRVPATDRPAAVRAPCAGCADSPSVVLCCGLRMRVRAPMTRHTANTRW